MNSTQHRRMSYCTIKPLTAGLPLHFATPAWSAAQSAPQCAFSRFSRTVVPCCQDGHVRCGSQVCGRVIQSRRVATSHGFSVQILSAVTMRNITALLLQETLPHGHTTRCRCAGTSRNAAPTRPPNNAITQWDIHIRAASSMSRPSRSARIRSDAAIALNRGGSQHRCYLRGLPPRRLDAVPTARDAIAAPR
jgi:hypothetical protein